MRVFRVCLLLLLAMLLPVRGAMAAGVLCAPFGGHEAVVADQQAGGHQEFLHGDYDHDHAQPGADDGDRSDALHGGHDKCNLCSSMCCINLLMGHAPAMPEPQDPTATVFPEPAAPPPNFLSGGQERPPRSI